MSKVNHDIRSNNGRTIFMPSWFQGETGWGNLAMPNVYVEDSSAKYPVGTKYLEGDRRFRYTKYVGHCDPEIHTALDATAGTDLLGKFLFGIGFPVAYSSTYTYGLADTDIVEVDTTTITIEKADDYYSGGWMNGKDTVTGSRAFFRRILSHDYAAEKVVGGSDKTLVSTLTVDQNLVNAFTAMALSITPNPFKRTVWQSNSNSDWYSMSHGASMVNNPTVNSFIWLQDQGPMGTMHIAVAAAGNENAEGKYRVLGDGAVQATNDQSDSYGTYQIAGYIIPNSITESGTGQDDSLPIIWVEVGK